MSTSAEVRSRPHWVYRCYDEAERLLYVGCTMDPVARRAAHGGNYVSQWFPYMSRFILRGPFDYRTARRVERELINSLDPYFNETSKQIGDRIRDGVAQRRFSEAYARNHPGGASGEDFWEAFEEWYQPRERPLTRYLGVIEGQEEQVAA